MNKEFITPTKENPIFIAQCSKYGGQIGEYDTNYPEWAIIGKKGTYVGKVFAISLDEAKEKLHQYINDFKFKNELKTKFSISVTYGELSYSWLFKNEDVKFDLVYQISMKEAIDKGICNSL